MSGFYPPFEGAELPDGGFSIVYADPPWSYSDKTCNGGVGFEYLTMPLDEIKALPVPDLVAPDAVLFLWVTYPFLREGLELIDAWGFTYKSIGFQWVKTKGEKTFCGLGRWTRGNTEPCLIATRGKPRRAADAGAPASVRQLVFWEDSEIVTAPVQRHSAKPPEVRDRIVTLMGDLPRHEMFARSPTPGWWTFGDDPNLEVDR